MPMTLNDVGSHFCCLKPFEISHYNHTPQLFYAPFFGTTRVSRCQKKTSGLMVPVKINRGRHTDNLAGRHSIRTNQCPPPSPLPWEI